METFTLIFIFIFQLIIIPISIFIIKHYLTESVKVIFNERLESFKKDLQIDFAKEIEPFKSSLAKENIGYQIYTTEFVKHRFSNIDELYINLYSLQNFIYHNMYNFDYYKDDKNLILEIYNNLLNTFASSYSKARLYMNENTENVLDPFLKECSDSKKLFEDYFKVEDYLEHKTYKDSNEKEKIEQLSKKEKILNAIKISENKFLKLMKEIEKVFKDLLFPSLKSE